MFIVILIFSKLLILGPFRFIEIKGKISCGPKLYFPYFSIPGLREVRESDMNKVRFEFRLKIFAN